MAFIFKVTTTGASESFTIPCQNVGTFNATIDWGDGSADSTITAYNDADLAHTYATADTYTITVTGTFPNIYFNNGGDKLKIIEVVDLGAVGWQTLSSAFYGCSNLTSVGGDTADVSSVTSMYRMFFSCSSLTMLDASAWDVSSVTSMYQTFLYCSNLTTLDVSSWDVSSVTTIQSMFQDCSSLTMLDVSAWDVSSVTGMYRTFLDCSSLTSLDVSAWDVSSVTTMQSTFQDCSSLTSLSIRNWTPVLVTNGTSFLLSANSALSQDEYEQTLINWSKLSLQSGVTWHFGDAVYSDLDAGMSIQMEGRISFSDDNSSDFVWQWGSTGASNQLRAQLRRDGAYVGGWTVEQYAGGVLDAVVEGVPGTYTPGLEVPFNIAARHATPNMNISIDGTALTADTTLAALPDLSATDLNLGYDFMGTISRFRMWDADIEDAGIVEASAPSLEPSLHLSFDGTEDSYTVSDWRE